MNIWQSLADCEVFSDDSDGPAYADFVVAYALRPFDQAAAAELARKALIRFEQLQARVPMRYDRRLGQVREFLAIEQT